MRSAKNPFAWSTLLSLLVAAFLAGRIIFGWTNPTGAPGASPGAISTAGGNVGVSQAVPASSFQVGTLLNVSTSTNVVSVSSGRLAVKGIGLTGSTNAFSATNANDTSLFTVFDNGYITFGAAQARAPFHIANGGISLGIDSAIQGAIVPQIGQWNGKAPLPFYSSTLVTGTYYNPAIFIAPDGLPLIIYSSSADLYALKCGNILCTSGNTTTLIDSSLGIAPNVSSSITVSASGLPLIAYTDSSGSRVKLALCNDVQCATSTKIVLGSTGSSVFRTDIAIGNDGFPFISYATSGGRLAVFKCNDSACGSSITSTLVTSANMSEFHSLAMSSERWPLIAYQDGSPSNLKLYRCVSSSCAAGGSGTTVDAAGSGIRYPSMSIKNDGLPVIAYINGGTGNLKVASCESLSCGVNTNAALDTALAGAGAAVAIAPDGLPIVAYKDESGDLLRIIKCGSNTCVASNTTNTVLSGPTVDNGVLFLQASVTIGADGLPVGVYLSNNDVSLFRCGSSNCLPYWTRR